MADASPLAAGMTFLGLIILTFGLYVIMKLRRLLGSGTLKRAWDRLMILVILFIVGYVGFLVQVLFDVRLVNANLIAGALFLFGAVFVAAVAYLNYDALT